MRSRLFAQALRRRIATGSKAGDRTPAAQGSVPGSRATAHNPGMNANVFRSLVQPAQGKLTQARYTLRWDWHLRNFLMALVPPAGVYAFLIWIEWYHRDATEGRVKLVQAQERKSERALSEVELVAEKLKVLESSVEALREDAARVQREREREAVVERARAVLRKTRQGAD